MKQFYVRPEDIAQYAIMVGRAHEATREAKEYAEKYGEISVSEQSWLADLGDSHKMIMEALNAELDGLMKSCAAGNVLLNRVATYYSQTDEAAATKMDGTVTDYNDRQDYADRHYRNGEWVK